MQIKTATSHCIDDLGLATNTKLAYRKGLKKFVDFLNEQDITEDDDATKITMDHFVYFLPWLDRKYKKQTVGLYGSASKAFLDWLTIAKIIEPSYLDSVRYTKSFQRSHKRREDKLPRFPNKTDVPNMLKAVRLCEEDSPAKERNIALIELLASSGCRISEITNLNVRDIDFETRSAIVTGKGSKQRRAFFSTSAMDALEAYWHERGSAMATDPILSAHDKGVSGRKTSRMTPTTARTTVKQVAMVAGIDTTKFSPHYFRHAFAIRVLSETHDLALAQDLLGHANPMATRVYAKIHAEDLRDAHREIFK
jgi:site-specific recombinase XerD